MCRGLGWEGGYINDRCWAFGPWCDTRWPLTQAAVGGTRQTRQHFTPAILPGQLMPAVSRRAVVGRRHPPITPAGSMAVVMVVVVTAVAARVSAQTAQPVIPVCPCGLTGVCCDEVLIVSPLTTSAGYVVR